MSKELHPNILPINDNADSGFLFMQKSYDETVDLLTSATDYFRSYGSRERLGLTRQERMIYTLAMSMITIQLTSVLGWLMAQKAVTNGEITAQEAVQENYRLQHIEGFSFKETEEAFHILSQPMNQLLKKSQMLYERIKRLEASVVARTPVASD